MHTFKAQHRARWRSERAGDWPGVPLRAGNVRSPALLSPSTGADFSRTGKEGPLRWETKLGLAFLRGLSYRDGALVVAQAGYYYIYSKVQLGGTGCSQGLTGCLPITHGLYKRTASYPEEVELLVNRRSRCGRADGSQVWWDSSFLGGVVHLDVGDEVVVRMPGECAIQAHDGTRSSFEAFMV